jgi:hypothetical protein
LLRAAVATALLILRAAAALGVAPTVLRALAATAIQVLQYLVTTATGEAWPASGGSTAAGVLQWGFALVVVHRFPPEPMEWLG